MTYRNCSRNFALSFNVIVDATMAYLEQNQHVSNIIG